MSPFWGYSILCEESHLTRFYPFLGTLKISCRIIIGTQKGTMIFTTTQVWRCRQVSIFLLDQAVSRAKDAKVEAFRVILAYYDHYFYYSAIHAGLFITLAARIFIAMPTSRLPEHASRTSTEASAPILGFHVETQ